MTQGSTDFCISQLSFLKREELISKTLNVISILKKDVIGKLIIKARISYSDSNNILTNLDSLRDAPRSSSAIPFENRSASNNRGSMTTYVNGCTNNIKNYQVVTSSFNPLGNSSSSFLSNNKNKPSFVKNSLRSGLAGNCQSPSKNFLTEKKSMTKGNNTSLNAKEQSNKMDDMDKSRIETLFDDDNIKNIEGVGNNVNNFINQFRSRYKEKFEENPEDKTKQGFQKIIDQLFDLQEIYYEDFGKACTLNSLLKSFLISYNENFREYFKKTNRLNEKFNNFELKRQFAEVINRQDNQRILDSIDIVKKELKIYKNIFKLKYDQDLVDKYKEEMRSDKCKKNINFLLICIYLFLYNSFTL